MGTRNLTCVVSGGEYRVAQYGQWDGYPGGQGRTILGFLLGYGNIEKLKAALQKVRFLDKDGRDKEFIDQYNANAPKWSNDPDNRTPEQKRWFSRYASRDLGGKILGNIASGDDAEILLFDRLAFAGDSLSCEYAYVVDFDKGTFEVYEGFNKQSLAEGERFADQPTSDYEFPSDDDEPAHRYYGVKHRMTFDLGNLPSIDEFLAALKDDDEDE